MTRSEIEQELIEQFDQRYEVVLDPLMLDIEEEVQGTRVGASSWTTPGQLRAITSEIGLSYGDLLLDVGCGTGWAGIAIARETGARLVLTDLPLGAIRIARDAAADAGVDSGAAVADATLLPFPDHSFSAITHSDVLCCLSGKQAAIREMRRVLDPSGVMVFTVILVDESLSFEDAITRLEEHSRFAASERPYLEMLTDAGFDVEVDDWTGEFRDMSKRLTKARETRLDGLKELLGEEEAEAQVGRGRWNVEAIDEGVLKRHVYVAHPS